MSGPSGCGNTRPSLTTTSNRGAEMADKKCSKCEQVKPEDYFYAGCVCRPCRLKDQRERRRANGNAETRRYEKTKRGFLMRVYRNMKSRVTGVQRQKFHLYAGKYLLPKEEFYAWALQQPQFHDLFDAWEQSEHERRLAPTVDRADSDRGYRPTNMEWVTHSENSRRGAISKRRNQAEQREAA